MLCINGWPARTAATGKVHIMLVAANLACRHAYSRTSCKSCGPIQSGFHPATECNGQ